MKVAVWYNKDNTDPEKLMIVTSMDTEVELSEKIIMEIDPKESIHKQVKEHLGL